MESLRLSGSSVENVSCIVSIFYYPHTREKPVMGVPLRIILRYRELGKDDMEMTILSRTYVEETPRQLSLVVVWVCK